MTGTPKMTAATVDTHVHVIDPARFPFSPLSAYWPLPCECGTAADLVRVLDAHAVRHVVLVTPTSAYGDDNACMLDALQRLGGRARGIARVPISIPPCELDALTRCGVVGVRIDFIGLGLASLADPGFERLLTALADRDLVLDVQAEAEQWNDIVPAIARVPVRVAVDHMGRPRPEQGIDAPSFKALLGLAATGRTVVKLSGLDRFSRLGPPFVDTAPFAAAIVREFTAERLVWGSDWPFLRSPRRVDYGPSLSSLATIVEDENQRQTILDITPARWFGFPVPTGLLTKLSTGGESAATPAPT